MTASQRAYGGRRTVVESMSPGPYLDVFARRHRFNWDVYGNEVYSDIPLVGGP